MERDKIVTKKKAAELLGVSPRTIDRWRAEGALRSAVRKLGPRMVRFSVNELMKIVEHGYDPEKETTSSNRASAGQRFTNDKLEEMARRILPFSLLPWPQGAGWTVRDVARYLGISNDHALGLLRSGQIKCADVGGGKGRMLRTSRRAVHDYLNRKSQSRGGL